MSFNCEKENEDVLRLLASNRKIMELILELGVVVNKSSLVELMNQGFQMNDIQHA
jgi:radical SAM superfamily enzyme